MANLNLLGLPAIPLDAALADVDRSHRRLHAAQLLALSVCERVHSVQAKVDTRARGVNGQHGDAVLLVLDAVTLAAVGGVVRDAGNAADEGESRDISLCLPAVARHETVLTVRAGNNIQRTLSKVVTSVVRD